jgi:salicylate hydroxylase
MNAKVFKEFVVAGAGIGGMSAALALARIGHRVTVLEKFPGVGEIGYGIQIAPNGSAMLERLGVLKSLEPHCFYPDALVLADAMDGRELTRIELGQTFVDRYKYRYFVIHRRDLHGALYEACMQQSNVTFVEDPKEVTGFREVTDRVIVECADGSTYEADALIGADGLRSAVRGQIVADGSPRVSGHVVYRGLVPFDEVIERNYQNSMVIYVGPGLHLVQYRLRGGTVMNNVATFESPAFNRGENEFGGTDELFSMFDQCDPRVKGLLRYISLDKNWILHDRDPVTNWSKGRVTLLGDAAHPTLQYLAQGAIMAMEDAVTLAHELDKAGPEHLDSAFGAYQDKRMNRTARVVLSSRLFGHICHAGKGARQLRNELARLRPTTSTMEIDWLYRGIQLD